MNRLRQVRKNKGLTVKEVADEIGFSETRLYQYETEKREPKKETWIKLADYYNVPVSYLMGLTRWINQIRKQFRRYDIRGVTR